MPTFVQYYSHNETEKLYSNNATVLFGLSNSVGYTEPHLLNNAVKILAATYNLTHTVNAHRIKRLM